MTSVPDVRRFGDVRAVRATMEGETRAALLDAAAVLLSEEGPSALTVRRVADAVNASTKMIYTHFGGKDGLFNALYLHSFAGLTRAFQAELAEQDPFARLEKMIAAYRAFALGEASLYNVMFGDLGRAWQAPVESRRQAWTSFETLRDTVRLCLPPERAAEASRISYLLWAAMHGVVSLELRKLLGNAEDGQQLYGLAVSSVYEAQGLRR
ncbi:TetR/AcrR family transcriptional regulator [Rhizorhabdus dicambivorans]|uniref:TetR/AcrR family transcriptional regulator n=1 Tax=Rhizorhabdus dicambivorans TaxID=1850238 RepID=A0A2A4FWY7_9SPHN|nr:TetR/AcrR family transcriptional regulator [Rhizorhabdus dicambivorans]ATE63592.1 TetR/AcrR family transcriptional regulator [Rhizorhabdus dicambivorans]PCE42718.1 TetR/AcrR family transcriptional regulator [Rhizorhabdus dicambivorans]